jgi:hypothetical protein
MADPKEISFDEISPIYHPFAEMIHQCDMERAKRISDTLTHPFHKINPAVLIQDVAGYVFYLPTKGFAYYYAE